MQEDNFPFYGKEAHVLRHHHRHRGSSRRRAVPRPRPTQRLATTRLNTRRAVPRGAKALGRERYGYEGPRRGSAKRGPYDCGSTPITPGGRIPDAVETPGSVGDPARPLTPRHSRPNG